MPVQHLLPTSLLPNFPIARFLVAGLSWLCIMCAGRCGPIPSCRQHLAQGDTGRVTRAAPVCAKAQWDLAAGQVI